MKAPNLHERIEAEEGPAGPSNRKFGVSLGVILVAFAVFGMYFGRGWGWWLLAGGACLVTLGLVLPAALSPLNRAWTGLGLVLFHIVNPVVMALIYVLTIVPIGAILRMLGKDPLRTKPDRGAATYWVTRNPPGPAPRTMKNQF